MRMAIVVESLAFCIKKYLLRSVRESADDTDVSFVAESGELRMSVLR